MLHGNRELGHSVLFSFKFQWLRRSTKASRLMRAMTKHRKWSHKSSKRNQVLNPKQRRRPTRSQPRKLLSWASSAKSELVFYSLRDYTQESICKRENLELKRARDDNSRTNLFMVTGCQEVNVNARNEKWYENSNKQNSLSPSPIGQTFYNAGSLCPGIYAPFF